MKREQGLSRTRGDAVQFGARPADYVTVSHQPRLWSKVLPIGAGEKELFPGLVVIVLALGVLVPAMRRDGPSAARARAGRRRRAALRRNRGRGVRAVDGAGAGAPRRPPLLDRAVRLAGSRGARPRRPACAGPLRRGRLRRAGGARRLRCVAAARSRDGAGDSNHDRDRARRRRDGRGLHGPAAARARAVRGHGRRSRGLRMARDAAAGADDRAAARRSRSRGPLPVPHADPRQPHRQRLQRLRIRAAGLPARAAVDRGRRRRPARDVPRARPALRRGPRPALSPTRTSRSA